MQLAGFLFPQYFDDNGNPLSGGKIYAYAAGTLTPQTTYNSASGVSANTNPIILSSSGRTKIFLQNLPYDFQIRNSAGVIIDNIESVGSSANGGYTTLNSFFDLTNLAAGAYNYVEVGGWESVGDGGGGLFYWDATSTTTANYGTVFTPNSLPVSGRWIRLYSGPVNAKWFDARGDGSTDDTSALTRANNYVQALANGGILFFPVSSGSYYLPSLFVFGTKVTVEMDSGAYFSSAATAITFNGKFIAGPTKHFANSVGVITFAAGAVNEVFPEWFGALGDGSTDDVLAIQKALTTATTGTLTFLDKTYIISVAVLLPSSWTIRGVRRSSRIKAKSATVWGDQGMIRLVDVSDAAIRNITVDGNKAGNATQTGATGSETQGRLMCIEIRGATVNPVIEGVTVTGAQAFNNTTTGGCNGGDGIYVVPSATGGIPFNVNLKDVIADDNYRQGMTINGVNGFTAIGSVFKNTTGTNPGGGLDMEPDDVTHPVTDVSFFGCEFTGNEKGILVYDTRGSDMYNIVFEACKISSNRAMGVLCESAGPGTVTFINCEIASNGTDGLQLNGASLGLRIMNNRVRNNAGLGINFTFDPNRASARFFEIFGNYIIRNGSHGIEVGFSSSEPVAGIISHNHIFNNGTLAVNTYDGISFRGDPAAVKTNSFCLVTNNILGNRTDFSATLTQRDGIRIFINATKVRATFNDTQNNLGAAITNNSGDAVIEFNYNNDAPFLTASGANSMKFTAVPNYQSNPLAYGSFNAKTFPVAGSSAGLSALGNSLLTQPSATQLATTAAEFELAVASSGTTNSLNSRNLSNTASSAARFMCGVAGSSALAAFNLWFAGSNNWHLGIEASSNDLVSGFSSTFGTNPWLRVASNLVAKILGRISFARAAAVTAAGDLTLGLDGNIFPTTGTTTINRITTTNWVAGSVVTLELPATAVVAHRGAATAGAVARINLNGAANFTVGANGGTLSLMYNGTDWMEMGRASW